LSKRCAVLQCEDGITDEERMKLGYAPEGWEYFKKGAQGQHGKNHYLINWKSLCGQYIVGVDERKYIHFVDVSELRSRKVCKVCAHFLKLKKSREKRVKELEEINHG